MPKINICLHNIVASSPEIQSLYDLSFDQLKNVIEVCEKTARILGLDSVVYYFDDGYKSFKTLVASNTLGIPPQRLVCAVITDLIGAPNRLDKSDVKALYKDGFGIVPHGASHAALAIFNAQDQLVATPSKPGFYRNSPIGKTNTLSSAEVLFQLNESRSELLKILPNLSIEEFVLPYGLYNSATVTIARSAQFNKLLTCHSALDDGQFLAPRHLVTQENINTLEDDLKTLSTSFTPLDASLA